MLPPDSSAARTRLGVIGMGRWGRTLIDAFARHGDVVVACNRGGAEARRWLAEHHPATRPSTDARDAFDDPSLDAVVIATPIPSHAELALAALAAGRHVFVEKPLATEPADARRVTDAGAAAGRRLFVGHTFLFDPAVEVLRAIVDPGSVTAVRTRWLKWGTFDEPLAWNLLPHEVALVLWLTGMAPDSVEVVEAVAGRTALDRLRLVMRGGGAVGDVEIDRTRDVRDKALELETRDGTTYRWRDGTLERTIDGLTERLVDDRTEPLDREVRAFLGALDGEVPAQAGGPFASAVVDVIARVVTPVGSIRTRSRSLAPGVRT